MLYQRLRREDQNCGNIRREISLSAGRNLERGGGGGSTRLTLEERGGAGSASQNLLYQKWHDQIFPIVNKFRFLQLWSLWSGGGGGRDEAPDT